MPWPSKINFWLISSFTSSPNWSCLWRWTEQKSATVSDFTLGRWVENNTTKGIRRQPYSVNSWVKSLNSKCPCWVLIRYSRLSAQSTHSSTADLISLQWMCTVRNFLEILQIKLTHFLISAAGEIWANMLHNVYAALVNRYGFSSTARTNPYGREGNIVFLHLFMDGLSKQPCYPTCEYRAHPVNAVEFVNWFSYSFLVAAARDAIILSDALRYKGVNRCLLWKVFASRGLGKDSKAKPYHQDGYEIPANCENRGSTRP